MVDMQYCILLIKGSDIMKKKILYILLIILIICFIGVVAIVIKSKNEDKTNTKVVEITEDRLKELFDNSYNYYLLYEGFDKDSTGSLELDNVKYTKVNNFKTFEEIDNMINNTFVKSKREMYYNDVFTNRNYLEVESGVYFEYKDHCDNIAISYDNITVNKVSDNVIFIDAEYTGVNAYYEDNNWYLDGPLHFCNKNKEST